MKEFDGWPHVINSNQFSREWLMSRFLPLTDEMEQVVNDGGCDVLRNKRMVSLFYQPSTRTRMSFEFAMDYLGGRTVFTSENAGEFSSAKKGESLADTIRVINCYRPDAIVIRYDKGIGAEFAAEVSSVPIINAGDREPGQHPTQSLLDLRTIFKCRGEVDGLKVAMVGDLKNGRTVRSLSYLLAKFCGIEIFYVAPGPLEMQTDVKNHLHRHGVKFFESTDLRRVAPNVDVIYQTRTQVECGDDFSRKNHDLGHYLVDKEILDSMKPDAIVMHPLPRVDEITPEVDLDPRAVYLTKQIESGLYTRMALLQMILAPKA